MTRRPTTSTTPNASGLETSFDAAFATELALREKQIQQNYRPVIGIHKWFARRPGTVFRSLLLAEFGAGKLRDSFWKAHRISGVIGDPFMGGGTPVYEANRLGFHVVGCDINPMAHWIVRQSLAPLDIDAFAAEAARVVEYVDGEIGSLYKTKCGGCGNAANVKYFLWVKTAPCPHCNESNDLFPGYRLAEAERHPRHVLACAGCGALNEYDTPPTRATPGTCTDCGHVVHMEGNVARKKLECRACHQAFSIGTFASAPEHRMWALEYHCERCYKGTPGRQFKKPDREDLACVKEAEGRFARESETLPIPDDEIPAGDESDRLHRWGYQRYREMFGTRQLLGLGILLERIRSVPDVSVRNALLTVFSDTLRYQNLLCRYDTYALKCQDIFSVHGFPVGLVQCENNLLGIARVGSGSFRHFVEKYVRAKQYCRAPFETRHAGTKKEVVPIVGESIEATFVSHLPDSKTVKQALLVNAPSQNAPLQPNSLDGVFTDPPYFDNVQYAELIDFCFVWLRQALLDEEESFARRSTRSTDELTGNETLGRGIDHFAAGISDVFQHFAKALKPGGPFVFTYHHNDPTAYLPLVLAILDADLDCTATLPAAAEMSASLHISGTGSSILDSVFVCRKPTTTRKSKGRQVEMPLDVSHECRTALAADAVAMRSGGVKITLGDLRCLIAGHVARIAIRTLRPAWNRDAPLPERLRTARECLERTTALADTPSSVEAVLSDVSPARSKSSSSREARP
jgi:adenine-specific DNA methylase